MQNEINNMTIRLMIQSDLEQVAEIEKNIFSQPWSAAGFAASLSSGDTIYLVAESDGRIIGYCGLLRSFDEADITNMAVSEKNRRQGTAFRLLTELMRQGKKAGISRFTLEVRESNTAAIRLYERLGFESVGKRKHFYSFPSEDALIMWTHETAGQ